MQCTFCEVNKEKKVEQEEENSIKNCILRPQFSRPTICNFRGGEKGTEKKEKKENLALKDFTSTKVQCNQKNK